MSSTSRRIIAVVTLCTLLATSACSVVFMQRLPSEPEPGAPLKCTSEREIPWWDVIIGGASALVGAGTLLAGGVAGSGDSRSGSVTAGLVFLGLGGAFGYSAHKGFGWAAECERVKSE